MSRLEDLISEYCPEGVEYIKLSDLAYIGNNGVDKRIIDTDKKIKLLNYMDVYRNQRITNSTLSMEVTATDRQISDCNILEGDLFITPTSETKDDLAHSAVAEETIDQAVYSYHVMRIRLKNKSMTSSYFLNYLFRSTQIQKQIFKKSNGITRFGLTIDNWSTILLPFPPIIVQREIVHILDKMTELERELEAELEARILQYEHYRVNLLDFEPKENFLGTQKRFFQYHQNGKPDFIKLGEVAEIRSGWGFPVIEQGNTEAEFPFYKVSDMNIPVNNREMTVANNYIDQNAVNRLRIKPAPKGTIIFPKIGAAIGTNKKRILSRTSCYDNNVMGIICSDKINNKFLFYLFETYNLLDFANFSGALPSIRSSTINSHIIPLPSLPIQEEIVAILDRFEALVSDLKDGLPAEIAARRKQYEYYRNQLLTFPPLEAE